MSDTPKPASPGLPPCGLYVTGKALAKDPEFLPEGRLVMFHNHSKQNQPFVQIPKNNEHNTWSFQDEGPGLGDDPEFIEALIPRKMQGIYFLRRTLDTGKETIAAQSIVQLGYNLNGDPILFPGYFEDGAIRFPHAGLRFETMQILEELVPEAPIRVAGQKLELH